MLAMQKMGAKPENTVVIDNSYTAMKGIIKSGCLPISFLSRERYENSEWSQRLRNIGVEHIFCKMSDIQKLIG